MSRAARNLRRGCQVAIQAASARTSKVRFTVEPLELVPEGGFQLVIDKEQATGYLPSILNAQSGARFAGHFDTLDPRTECNHVLDAAPNAVTAVTKSLIRDLDGDCEIIAQFELGKYLKQLDPTYHHPDYRVDFLVRVSDGGKQHQLMLEYDGFEFHLAKGVPPGMINSSTWPMYLTAGDLEREKVLESFGVQMIRLNKFNLGKDAVATIDGLLRERLDGMMNGGQPHDFVKSVAKKTTKSRRGLKPGTISAARSATAIFRSTCFETAV